MSRVAWPQLMRAGMRGLRLTPEQFWRLTPAELMLMLGAGAGRAPLTRNAFEALERRFPDSMKGRQDGGTGRD